MGEHPNNYLHITSIHFKIDAYCICKMNCTETYNTVNLFGRGYHGIAYLDDLLSSEKRANRVFVWQFWPILGQNHHVLRLDILKLIIRPFMS